MALQALSALVFSSDGQDRRRDPFVVREAFPTHNAAARHD